MWCYRSLQFLPKIQEALGSSPKIQEKTKYEGRGEREKRIKETKSWFLEKINNKVFISLDKLTKRKGKNYNGYQGNSENHHDKP